MPRGLDGLTHRQERFCRAFVEYGNASTAARAARYAPRWAANHGYRLLKQPRIRARIGEIQAELARDGCSEMDVFLGKLETIYRRAVEDHHFYAAARAVEIQARLSRGRSVGSRQIGGAAPDQGRPDQGHPDGGRVPSSTQAVDFPQNSNEMTRQGQG